MFTSLRSHRTRQKSKKPDRRFSPGFLGTEGALEERVLLSTIALGKPLNSGSVETNEVYDVNSYMPALAATHGTGSYSYLSWGLLEIPTTAATVGASDLTSLSLQLYNTATSGNYSPYSGNYDIYVIPNDSTAFGNFRYLNSGSTGIAVVGSTAGQHTDPSVGITAPEASWDLGTLNIPVGTGSNGSGQTYSSLGIGYDTFTATSATWGANAKATILSDVNNGTPIRLAIVPDDLNVAVDWEGNYSSNYPLMSITVVDAPKISFSAPTYNVTQTAGAATTPVTFQITRSAPTTTATTMNWSAVADAANPPVGGFTTQNGSVTFLAGSTSQNVTINVATPTAFQSQLTGTIDLSLSDPGGNSPTPVLGATPTANAIVTYAQGSDLGLSSGSYTVNESAGTATFTIQRTGTVFTNAVSATFTTADGTPYLLDPQNPQDAQAGRDYTTTTQTVSFAANDSTPKTVTVPIINVKTFAGTRSFTVSLSNPSSGVLLGPITQATETITDNAVTAPGGVATPFGITTDGPLGAATQPGSSGIETGGPYYTDSYTSLVSTPHGSWGYSTFPEWEFWPSSSAYPTGYTISNVDSIELSVYNTATTGGYGGTPGSFTVWDLTNDSVATTSLRYAGGTGNYGDSVISGQAGAVKLGVAQFPNNQVGYNNFVLDNIPASVTAAIKAEVAANLPIRLVAVPNDPNVAADWEGNYTENQPILTMLIEKASAATLPAWLSPSSDATWVASTHTLTVNGPATIIADPGTDSPNIVENAAADQLTISPTTVGFVNLGGVTLTNGAGITVPSVGSGRTHTNHNVIVIDAVGSTPGTFSIDATSKFDLADNDMILQDGGAAGAAAVQALATTGRDYPNDDWTGKGLTSSTAATVDGNLGYEQNLLAVALNSALPLGPYSQWQAGTSTLTLTANDVIVKYTYNGDFTLDGKVDANDYTVFGTFYDAGASTGNPFIYGDTTGDGKIDATDYTYFATFYGLGTGGANGPQL